MFLSYGHSNLDNKENHFLNQVRMIMTSVQFE